jgi:hypothetical protein
MTSLSLVTAVLLTVQFASGTVVSGVVRDPSGQIVPGATVTVRTAAGVDHQGVTGTDGRFRVVSASAAPPVTVRVSAPGFGERALALSPCANTEDLDISLPSPSVAETVHVTAYGVPQRLQDVAASVNTLSREDIRRSPALVADDLLR